MRLANATIFIFLFAWIPLWAQTSSRLFVLQGSLVDSTADAGIEGVEILLPFEKRVVYTGADGVFRFDNMRPGIFTLCIATGAGLYDTLRLFADPAHPVLSPIHTAPSPAPEAPDTHIPEVTIPTDDGDDSGPGSSDYAAATQAGRNPFTDATAFNLFPFRFQSRSYNRRTQELAINALPVHDAATLNVPWSSWTGLNDAFRNREQRYGIGASDGIFGGLAGSLGFDISAASQRPQQRLGYSMSNRSFRNRINYSRSSGILPSGWAWSVNIAYRAAGSGFVPGTFQEGASLYASLSRIPNASNSLHLSFVGAWSRVGRSAAVTEETVRLSGNPWYNPNWGLQNGRERNARVSTGFQPFILLTHQYRSGSRFRAETSMMVQSGRSGTTGLDYYNASNPRPDYYRYLPSYLQSAGRDPDLATFHTKPQIEWDELYQQNRLQWDTVKNAGGVAGNVVAGKRAVYSLFRDVQDLRKLAAATSFQWRSLGWLQVSGGANGIFQQEERYRALADLLGGEFYLNTNAFIEAGANPQLAQYDLRVPDRIIREGDRYGYDYRAESREIAAWCGIQGNLRRLDVHFEGRVLQRRFQRDGRFQNGLFPSVSFGRSDAVTLIGTTLKGGFSYRIDGRTQVLANGIIGTTPPAFDQVFIAPRVRNTLNTSAKSESVHGIELGLMHRSGPLHLHLLGFATRTYGGSELRRYYSDDPAFASFVNYLMTGVARQFTGLELGADVRITSTLAFRAGLSLTDAFYSANPDGVFIYGDSDTMQLPVRRDVHIRNLAVANGPQTAGTLGLTYRSPKYWFAGISANYAARTFIDVNPDRRTEAAVRGLNAGTAVYDRILLQERLPAAWTLDLSAGRNWLLSKYSKRIPKNTYLYLNAAVSNLLDRRYRTGGYEQLRFDYANQDPEKFASKYFYALGLNFLMSASLRW